MQSHLKKTLWFLTLFTIAHMLYTTWGFLLHGLSMGSNGTLFNLLAWTSYSAVYALIGLAVAYMFARFNRSKPCMIMAVLLSSIMLLLVQADLMIYDLYNFHFNGFVWNLVTTKGGLESLGGDSNTYLAVALSVAITFALQALAWFISAKITITKVKWRYIAALLIPMMLGERILYGIADVRNNAAILDSAYSYPFYKKVTFRSFAEKLGYKAERSAHNKISVNTGRLQYPLAPVSFSAVKNPPNIVILVAESLRWDRLTPKIMPNTYALAQKGLWYKQHYSSGNGTREGLFGMFYGLYGSYWSSFLHAQQSPLLMDRLQKLDYQLDIRTSAKFSYPEFNKTLFAKVPLSQLHEASDALKPWQRDELNATQLINFISKRDKTKPLMSFFFLESTHARYEFPESSVIATPYLKDVNYWGMSRESLKPQIGALKNRYTNAAHWVDAQVGRVVDVLTQQGMLDNTIIIVTGDHGEEFMEKGFWGHNSSFVEEQTHTPFVMWVPNTAHAEINRLTSHLDVSATLLPLLGAPKDVHGYGLGANLLEDSTRKFIVVSDWHSISVLTDDMKYRIPYLSKGFDHWQPTDAYDKTLPADAASKVLENNQASILQSIKNTSQFLMVKNNRQPNKKNE